MTAHFTFSLKLLQLNKFNIALYRGFCRWVQCSPFNTCKQFCSRLQFAQTKMCLKRDIMRHWNLPSLNYINLPADKKAKVVKNKTGVNISHYTLIFNNFEYWLIDFLYQFLFKCFTNQTYIWRLYHYYDSMSYSEFNTLFMTSSWCIEELPSVLGGFEAGIYDPLHKAIQHQVVCLFLEQNSSWRIRELQTKKATSVSNMQQSFLDFSLKMSN